MMFEIILLYAMIITMGILFCLQGYWIFVGLVLITLIISSKGVNVYDFTRMGK